jgi:hypothetical protein
MSAPMPNHHAKDLNEGLVRRRESTHNPLPSATLAEGSSAVKKTAGSLNFRFHSLLHYSATGWLAWAARSF